MLKKQWLPWLSNDVITMGKKNWKKKKKRKKICKRLM